jgi:hypothetical protein
MDALRLKIAIGIGVPAAILVGAHYPIAWEKAFILLYLSLACAIALPTGCRRRSTFQFSLIMALVAVTTTAITLVPIAHLLRAHAGRPTSANGALFVPTIASVASFALANIAFRILSVQRLRGFRKT